MNFYCCYLLLFHSSWSGPARGCFRFRGPRFVPFSGLGSLILNLSRLKKEKRSELGHLVDFERFNRRLIEIRLLREGINGRLKVYPWERLIFTDSADWAWGRKSSSWSLKSDCCFFFSFVITKSAGILANSLPSIAQLAPGRLVPF